ncbi:glycoside hydrolase family 108 protein [Algibacter sp. PT7-4]|uniref:glycoside hydrolase family 108 protein n=1 Tax=Algibacter ulvanivorans TaxID=3400999 RepID=UPI003AAF376A
MASFNLYIPLLVNAEGGYQKLQNDSGNYNSRGELVGTNHGVSAPVYENWIGRVPTEIDMRNITKTIALEIMKVWYWDKIGATYINNQSVANILADHAVNAGTGAAAKLVQETLNDNFGFNLKVDGAIGDKTRSAINNTNSKQLHEALKKARENFYKNIGGPWEKAWLKRLSTFVFKEKKKISIFLVLATLTGIGLYVNNISKNKN